MLRIVIPTNKNISFILEKLFALEVIAKQLDSKFDVHVQFNKSIGNSHLETRYEYLNVTINQTKPETITAEENLLVALKNSVKFDCWTWILGDDDYFNIDLIRKIIDSCEISSFKQRYSVISLNNNLFNENHSPVFSDSVITNENSILSVKDFIQLNGLISSSAGFSNWVLFLTPLNVLELDETLNRNTKIYWHLPWILSIAFQFDAIKRIESPKLQYTLNTHDGDNSKHWTNYTDKVGIEKESPWGENLIDLVNFICLHKYFMQENIKFITERDSRGNKYNLGEFITLKTLNEILSLLEKRDMEKARFLSKKLVLFAYGSNLFPGTILAALFNLIDVETLEKRRFRKEKDIFLNLLSDFKSFFGSYNYTWIDYWSKDLLIFCYSGCEFAVHRRCFGSITYEDFIRSYFEIMSKETMQLSLCKCNQLDVGYISNNYDLEVKLRNSNVFKAYKRLPRLVRRQIRKIINLD